MKKSDNQNPKEVLQYGMQHATVHWDLSPKKLQKITIDKGVGKETKNGALGINTGKYKGRFPRDRFIVKDDDTRDKVWRGKTNKSVSAENFDKLQKNMVDYLSNKELFASHGYPCTDTWSGGPYGISSKIKLKYTRAMITAALEGKLDHI